MIQALKKGSASDDIGNTATKKKGASGNTGSTTPKSDSASGDTGKTAPKNKAAYYHQIDRAAPVFDPQGMLRKKKQRDDKSFNLSR